MSPGRKPTSAGEATTGRGVEVTVWRDQPKSVGAQGVEVRASRDQHDVLAGLRQLPADDPTDRTGAVDDVTHSTDDNERRMQQRRSGRTRPPWACRPEAALGPERARPAGSSGDGSYGARGPLLEALLRQTVDVGDLIGPNGGNGVAGNDQAHQIEGIGGVERNPFAAPGGAPDVGETVRRPPARRTARRKSRKRNGRRGTRPRSSSRRRAHWRSRQGRRSESCPARSRKNPHPSG